LATTQLGGITITRNYAIAQLTHGLYDIVANETKLSVTCHPQAN